MLQKVWMRQHRYYKQFVLISSAHFENAKLQERERIQMEMETRKQKQKKKNTRGKGEERNSEQERLLTLQQLYTDDELDSPVVLGSGKSF